MNRIMAIPRLIVAAFQRFVTPGYMLILACVTWVSYKISVWTGWFYYSDKEAFVNVATLLTMVFGYLYWRYFGPVNEQKDRIGNMINLFVSVCVGFFAAYPQEILSITGSQVLYELLRSIIYVFKAVCGIVIGSLILWTIARIFRKRYKLKNLVLPPPE